MIKVVTTAMAVTAMTTAMSFCSFASTISQTDLSAQESAIIELINKTRTDNGVSALTVDERLKPVTDLRAAEQLVSFSHTRPDGSDWWTANPDLMYGEILGNKFESAEAMLAAWVNDEPHRLILMDSNYTIVESSVRVSDSGEWFWCVEFGK